MPAGIILDPFHQNQLWTCIFSMSSSKNKATLGKIRRAMVLPTRTNSSASHGSRTTSKPKSPPNSVTPLPVHSQSQPEDSISGGFGSLLDLTPKPGEVWLKRNEMMNVSLERQTINSVCANDLFPRVKFINKGLDMDYSENTRSICQFVMSRCNLSIEINHREWWERNRKHVINTITALRSNKMNALKWAFFGK